MTDQMGDLFPDSSDTARTTVAHVPASVSSFDYSALPADVADEARGVAKRIIENQELHLAMAVEAGRDLSAIKDKLGHGNWLPWLERECRINARTAQNYMAAAEAFGPKYETVAYLPASTVYRLAAPKVGAVREAVVSQIEAGDRLSAKDIENRIWQALQQHKQQRKKETPQDRKARVDRERKTRVRNAKGDLAEHEARTRAKAERRTLAEKLIEPLLAGLTDAELAELRASYEPLGAQSGAEILGRAILETLHPNLKAEREHWEERSLRDVRGRLDRALAS